MLPKTAEFDREVGGLFALENPAADRPALHL
jgi:hypothetical protein